MLNLKHLVMGFQVQGKCANIIPYGNGHIHDTYQVSTNDNSSAYTYILQKINSAIFRNPSQLMNNIHKVSSHILNKQRNMDAHCLAVVPTHIDTAYIRDLGDNYWRLYEFIDGISYEVVESELQAYYAARAFADFQKLLLDLDHNELRETIPGFHNTPRYLQFLKNAISDDTYNRAASAKTEIDFILQHEQSCHTLLKARDNGELIIRITHNDTKLNNILFAKDSGKALCVIDLDTVMPGLVHYDFGDMVRTYTSPAPEDEQDIAKIQMRMPIFKALAKGYMESMGDMLTAKEIELLPFSGKLLTLETAIRFLTDYLSGDSYFKTTYPEHNLVRCRSQIALFTSIEAQYADMQEFMQSLAP